MTFLKSSLPHSCQWYVVTKPSTLTQDLQPSTLLAEYHSINNHVILQDSSDYVSEPRSNSDRKDYIPISIYHDSYNYEPNPDFIKFPTKWPEVGRRVQYLFQMHEQKQESLKESKGSGDRLTRGQWRDASLLSTFSFVRLWYSLNPTFVKRYGYGQASPSAVSTLTYPVDTVLCIC